MSRLLCSAVVALLASLSATVFAGGDGLTLKIAEPGVRAYDSTALGRATHTVRLSLSNPTSQAVPTEPMLMRFRPSRDGIPYECDEPRSRDTRWPRSLDAGATFSFVRDVTCETPLPGRYQVEVLGRAQSAAPGTERAIGSFAMQIDPGPNPPLAVPWESSIFAAVAGTKDLRPVRDPNAARIVVALVNASKVPVTLGTSRVTLRVSRTGSPVAVCPERIVEMPFAGTLAPGRSQSQSTSLGCDISAEAQYDVEVGLAGPNGARLHLASHPIRVRVNAPDSPGPQDWSAVQFTGGS